ncbi:hypothetical protein ACM01_31355 [Streptomyces viridochromogenes]|uniref:Uncharacterized protein n=1 Tax=Streptomyces viridochromogenes TaxID=1938 RepID=A0A0J8BYC2_STRVR|nr:hypothetical protein [Streptomyces viridochromogenes]KMS70470.1 hypothetical protein ACM01_31355 [Streptomyces viridochromogenes]
MTSRNTDPVQHPRKAAEAVRAFNHATQRTRDRHPDVAYPGTVYRAIGAFTSLAHRLPQSYDQIGAALADLHTAGRLIADYGTPTEHAVTVSEALREAEQHATAMAEALERAHRAASPLGYCGPIDDTDDDL